MTDHNSWSWNQKLKDFSLLYSLFLIRFVGLWPYTINRRTNDFKTNWFLMLRPILSGIIFIILFVVFFRKLLPSVKRQWKSEAANMLMLFFGMLNTLSLITTYLTVFLQIKRIKSIIVRSKEFKIKSQRLLTDNTNRSASAVLQYLFKAVIVMVCLIVVVYLKIFFANVPLAVYMLPFLVVPVVVNNTVPILFFGAILFATVYFERINAKIAEIIRNANVLTLPKHNHFGRMHRYCELSDLLDELAILHMELTRLTQDVCKVCNLHMTGYVAWLTVNAILQKFFVYMCLSIWFQDLLDTRFQMELCVIGVFTIIIIWADLILLANVCFTITREVV